METWITSQEILSYPSDSGVSDGKILRSLISRGPKDRYSQGRVFARVLDSVKAPSPVEELDGRARDTFSVDPDGPSILSCYFFGRLESATTAKQRLAVSVGPS